MERMECMVLECVAASVRYCVLLGIFNNDVQLCCYYNLLSYYLRYMNYCIFGFYDSHFLTPAYRDQCYCNKTPPRSRHGPLASHRRLTTDRTCNGGASSRTHTRSSYQRIRAARAGWHRLGRRLCRKEVAFGPGDVSGFLKK